MRNKRPPAPPPHCTFSYRSPTACLLFPTEKMDLSLSVAATSFLLFTQTHPGVVSDSSFPLKLALPIIPNPGDACVFFSLFCLILIITVSS